MRQSANHSKDFMPLGFFLPCRTSPEPSLTANLYRSWCLGHGPADAHILASGRSGSDRAVHRRTVLATSRHESAGGADRVELALPFRANALRHTALPPR